MTSTFIWREETHSEKNSYVRIKLGLDRCFISQGIPIIARSAEAKQNAWSILLSTLQREWTDFTFWTHTASLQNYESVAIYDLKLSDLYYFLIVAGNINFLVKSKFLEWRDNETVNTPRQALNEWYWLFWSNCRCFHSHISWRMYCSDFYICRDTGWLDLSNSWWRTGTHRFLKA